MRILAMALVLASATVARADGDGVGYKVGVTMRRFVPSGAYVWRGAKTHALVTQLWYPAAASAVETPQTAGPMFDAGKAATDARLVDKPPKLPLIVLSHGTGGSSGSVAWLGAALAARGYVVAGVNHPGNNALEDYTVAGFTLWWERAHDLSTVIDAVLADATFGARIDRSRIGAAGFSLGGFTMIVIAGGVSDHAAYDAFCRSKAADDMCKPPPEFKADLMKGGAAEAARDREYAASLATERRSRRDPRVRAVFAIAPALGPAFHADDLRRIEIPVEIVAGAADDNVPVESSAKYFAAHIPGAKLVVYPGEVKHYVFLDECTPRGRDALPLLCRDPAGVDRRAVHDRTIGLAARFFEEHLP